MAAGKKLFKNFIKSVLTLCLISALAFTAMVFGLVQYQANQQVEVLKAQEQAKVRLTKWLLTQGFDYAASDLQGIAKLPVTRKYNGASQQTNSSWRESSAFNWNKSPPTASCAFLMPVVSNSYGWTTCTGAR